MVDKYLRFKSLMSTSISNLQTNPKKKSDSDNFRRRIGVEIDAWGNTFVDFSAAESIALLKLADTFVSVLFWLQLVLN